MKNGVVPPDDVLDIIELADQIQEEIAKLLHGKDMDLAVSALMTAITNMLASQEPSKSRLTGYRDVLFSLLTSIIERTTKE